MARINLLPWREQQRKEKQREFLTLVGLSCALMVVVLFYLHFQYVGFIDKQNSRNDFLTQQIAEVDKQIEEIKSLEDSKQKLVARMEVIQRLQESRPDIVRLFDQLARLVPEGIYLTDLARTDNKLRIEGVAQSNARVSAFMRNLDSSPWFGLPNLIIVEAMEVVRDQAKDKKPVDGFHFSLEVDLVVKGQPSNEEEKGGTVDKGAKA